MDKYEYKVKLEQIEKMASKKDYVTAAKIADGIDWRKEKSVSTLSLIADVYEKADRLTDCYELLNMVYDRSPIGRRIVYRMAEIAVKMHNFEEAIDLYKEFVRIAPNDLNKYILKYQIYRGRGSSIEEQIAVLENFKSHEYDEKWSYELACCYEEAGRIEECIEACDELILWFSEGEYVVKAMELKMKYQELTAAQQEKYERRFEYLEEENEEEFFEEDSEEEIEEALIAEALSMKTEGEEAADIEESEAGESEAEEVEETVEEETKAEEADMVETEVEDTPQISMINVNKFSTINLQEELARNLQEFLIQEEEVEEEPEKVITQEFIPVKVIEVEEEPGNKDEIQAAEETILEMIEEENAEEPLSETAELQTEILKYTAEPQQLSLEELLRTDEDGQMTLAIEEETGLQKQITGQMTIGEILEAWEVKKRQVREQIEAAEAKKPAVLFETGEISSVLEDFVPKTPIEKENTETAETTEEVVIFEETEESEEEQVWVQESELEDDLPQDIDFESEETVEEVVQEQKTSIGQNTAAMLDAIERALALEVAPIETAGTYLTEEQEKIFAYFTSVSGMKKQLITLLEEERCFRGKENSSEGNLIITGHPGNGKTTLAIDIVKAIQKQRKVKGAKLAKVSGDGFNKKNPGEVIQKLGGGALIIERAGSLKDEIVEMLSAAMDGYTEGLLVILEDDAQEIERLMRRHENFAIKFNRSVDIPIFSNDELVAFGKSYAEEKEYFFDDMAVLALYDCIGVRQTSEHVVNIAEVKEFIDDAIEHAEKKSKGIFARLSKKRIDEYGNKLLLEEDFNY